MKQIKYVILFGLITACQFVYAQVNFNIRPAFTLKLFVNDTTFYQAPMGATKFIPKDGIVQLFPGDSLFVEANIRNDSLVNLKVVPKVEHKEKTLALTFTQIHEGKQHQQMVLKIITNPFTKDIYYSALINLMQQKKWVKTSIVPVKPGLAAYETWPDIITTIVLSDFYLKD